MPELRQHAQRIYYAALQLDAAQRGHFLTLACGDDAGLRRDVDSLFESPPPEAALTPQLAYPEPLPGQTLNDRYRIISRLGSGGMGVVFRAEDLQLGRTVALKFLLESVRRDAMALERFRSEARILSALNHSNICAVYDICDAEGHLFIAMEYVPGKRLDELIDKRAMPAREALRYAVQMAAGLANAHAAGVVHRDLKPGNIMVNDEGRIKLLDFGIAKLTRHTDSGIAGGTAVTLTVVGAILGTAAYMSPEQAEAKSVDARSDVFAFGAVLYEMITGRRAFEGTSSIATVAAILRSEPEPASTVSPSVPAELDRIVARCLRKDPERRFQTAADLKVALEEIRDETESGRLVPASLKRPKRIPRSRILAALAVLGLMAVALLSAFWWRGQNPWPIPADKRIAVLLFTNVGGDPANQALCDGLVEEVSNSLTRLEQFHGALVVVPASDVRKEGITSARAAGQTLGANLAITGSVERAAGGLIHILINLVDTRTVTQLRTATIDTQAPDLPDLQEGVMAKVAAMLEFVLKPEAKRAVLAGNTAVPAAYAEYIKGLGNLRRYDRPENIDKAIQAFSRSVALDPKYVLASAAMAEAYWRRYEELKDSQSMDLALEYASKAVALNTGLAPVHITMGMIRAGKGEYEPAQAEFRTALTLDPLNAQAWLGLASTYDAAGQRDRAQSAYRKAVELRSDDWTTLKQIGVSYFNKAQYSEAEPYFMQVVQLTPDNAKAWSNLGGLYLKMGRWDDAARQLRKSISIEPTAGAWSNLGTSYYLADRYDDAIASFEKATVLTPANSTLWGNLADAYRWSNGQSDKAPETFRHALGLIQKEIDVNPRDPQLRAKAATYWAALKDRERADSEIEKALRFAPSNATVHFRAALVYEQGRQRDRALHEVKAALDLGYDLPEISHAPPLAGLRKDPLFRALVEKRLN
ncbi:MAG: protein kinase [Terriglobia bacterium]